LKEWFKNRYTHGIVMNKKKKRYYFDYAATTPVDRRVLKKMLPYFTEDFGNPSNLYSIGHSAKKAVADATKKITDILGCKAEEFVFTGSATESDNLAIIGTARANKSRGNPSTGLRAGRIIVSNVEHKGILSACEALKKEGFEVIDLKINKDGFVDEKELAGLIDSKTILVSIAYADSETGTIQPIRKLSNIIKEYRKKNNTGLPYFHTDAAQVVNYLDINVNNLGVDLMTLSAQKIYGPKGIGGLYIRRGTAVQPIIYGGGQQFNIRSGTENVPGIVGFGEAMELALKERGRESVRISILRDKLQKGILSKIDKVLVNGSEKKRLPNFTNLSILDIEGEAMLLYLDNKGIIVNTGSACNSQSLEPSYILQAFGRPYEYIHGSLRFTLGRYTTKKDIDYVARYLPGIVKKLRLISPLKLDSNDQKDISDKRAFIGGQTPHFLRKKK